MRRFTDLMHPVKDMKILDVGGQPQIWDNIDVPLRITCLNLGGIAKTDHKTHHNVTYVEGDGTDMPEFSHGEFDMVFSNSVIEHVGDYEKRKMFAEEIRRVSSVYWVQTPSKVYPVEAHCGMPFWWYYPAALKSFFLRRWRKKLPAWTEMVEETTVVSAKEIKELFPEAKLTREWLVFPKSIIAFSNQ